MGGPCILLVFFFFFFLCVCVTRIAFTVGQECSFPSLSLSLSPLVLDSLFMTSGRRRRRRRRSSSMWDPPDARVVAGGCTERGEERKPTPYFIPSLFSLSLSSCCLVVLFCLMAIAFSSYLLLFLFRFSSLHRYDTIPVRYTGTCVIPVPAPLAVCFGVDPIGFYVCGVGWARKKKRR